MTYKNPENLHSQEDLIDGKKNDLDSNPENSQAAKKVSDDLFKDVMKLRGDIDKPGNLERVQGKPEYEALDSQFKELSQVVDDPKNRDPKTGDFTQEGMNKIQSVYNALKESYKEVHGIINGSIGEADIKKRNEMEEGLQNSSKDLDHFTDEMKKRRSQEAVDQARKNAAEAKRLNNAGNNETGMTNPKIETVANSDLQTGLNNCGLP